jgi:GntR family transcriptional regulator
MEQVAELMRAHSIQVEKSSRIPLYYQLAEAIKEQIRSGELSPGDQLPGERDLAKLVGISRMTARQAIALLVHEGAIVVRHGTGTFIADPKLTYDALHLLGFTAEMMRQGGVAGSRVLEQTVVTPSPRVATDLNLAPGEQATKIVRLRMSRETPLLIETSFVPLAFYPELAQEDLAAQSLYALLEQRSALRLERARQSLEATIANDYESKLLGIKAGTPMILLEGVTFFERGQPVEYFKAIYRGDRFKFVMESQRNGTDEPVNTQRVSVVLAPA